MKLDYFQIVLDDYDISCLHDLVYSATGAKKLSDSIYIAVWNDLPDDIKADALKWGINDTPTREAIYTWLCNNIEYNKLTGGIYKEEVCPTCNGSGGYFTGSECHTCMGNGTVNRYNSLRYLDNNSRRNKNENC